MSDNVMSMGFFAKLKTPITDEYEQEEISEELYETSRIYMNYEGTLLYTDDRGEDPYGLSLLTDFDSHSFLDEYVKLPESLQNKLPIYENTLRPYICYWYNGTDSDMSMLTVDEFDK